MTEQIDTTPTDRTGWPAGPWDNEPDRHEWRDPGTGLACLARRGPLGAWCGYVAVPPGHLWHGRDYAHISVDVHGGPTYTDRCSPESGICHIPQEGEPADVWWVGFDCAHAYDIVPRMLACDMQSAVWGKGTYRDLDYVRGECERLARQVAEVAS